MESSERIVYSYRSTWGLVKAILTVLIGPSFIYLIVRDTIATSQHSGTPPYMFWVVLVIIAFGIIEQLLYLVTVPAERIIIEGSRLSYFNWLGKKRFAVELLEIKEIDKMFGQAWRVHTPQGSFDFSNKLNDYFELLIRLKDAGAVVYYVPKAYRRR